MNRHLKLLKELTEEAGANYRFEYSPESFTGTEPEYALEVCNAVLDIWQPTADRKAIINLPVTVQHSMPHVYAQQIEYMSKHMKYRENVLISLHPHNDRGCGVADTESPEFFVIPYEICIDFLDRLILFACRKCHDGKCC